MKSSTDITPVTVSQVKVVGEKCSSSTWCAQMNDFLNKEDLRTYTALDAANGLASVNTGKCAWCGGPIR